MAQLNLTLESPGVQINEIDLPSNPVIPIGTTGYLVGFAAQGPTDEPTFVSTLPEYEQVFGLPETAAERYAYNAAKQILTTSSGNLLFTRMPYGSGCGIGYANTYSALIFPVVGVSATEVDACSYYTSLTEANVIENFPWLYENYWNKENTCYGSQNLECPYASTAEAADKFVIHDYPVPTDGNVGSFKWVCDADSTPEQVTFYHLRPNATKTSFTVEGIFPLSSYATSDESGLTVANGICEMDVTSGVPIASGGGIVVEAGDLFATYSPTPVFEFYTPNVPGIGKSSVISTGQPVTSAAIAAALDGDDALDYLVSWCHYPGTSGISCDTVTALDLSVPEESKYTFSPVGGECQLNDANYYVFGQPIHETLSDGEYQKLTNKQFNWKCGCFQNVEALVDLENNDVRAGLIIINEAKTAQLEDFTGYYVAVSDNLKVNPTTDFDDVTGICGRYDNTCHGVSGAWTGVSSDRLNFNVSDTHDGGHGSISEIIEQNAGFDFGQDENKDSLIVSLFKFRPTRFSESVLKLDHMLVEKFVGSLNAESKKQDAFGGPPRTNYIEEVVNRGSNHMSMMVNPFLSENNCWVSSQSTTPVKTARVFRNAVGDIFTDGFDAYTVLSEYSDNLYGFGTYTGFCDDARFERCKQKDVGNIPCKLERALNSAQNALIYDIDITIDGGLSTVWATREAVSSDTCLTDVSICYNYDDTVFLDTNSLGARDGNLIGSALHDGWETVFNLFDVFAKRDNDPSYPGHLHVADPLRQIFVNGANFKVVNRQNQVLLSPDGSISKQFSTFSRNIWTYLRNLYQGVDSSYSASYANWIKDYDKNADKRCWFPSSGYAAAALMRVDQTAFPWIPVLGPDTGALPTVLDLGINPNQKERDLLYRINLNPVVNLPTTGNAIWGNKTLLKRESALDRVHVRRGLLFLEKATERTLWQFIGKPNTIITRTRVVNSLTPIFENARQNQGLYEYLIVCDERNNTPDVIDQNALNIDIYVKPVKGAEFISVNFIITRTGVDFGELVG